LVRNQQLVKQQHLHKLLLILIKVLQLVLLGYPAAIPAVAAAATVAGFGAVKTLLIPKYQHADGGAIPTLGNGVINNGANVVPLSNGDNTLAYVRQGEVILNQQQQALAGGSFFKSLCVPGFNAGGVVGGNTNINASGAFKIDMDLLAYKITSKCYQHQLLVFKI
jgi:hypothetical protein